MAVHPLMLSTWSFGPVANAAGMAILGQPTVGRLAGSALDAVVAAATAVEDDPSINSVGVGGIPDADGRVSLDGCVMTDPDRCGSVALLGNFPNPVAIARRVMERTIHVMLVGDGAEAFAVREGFARRELLTPAAAAEWQKWRMDPKAIDRDLYKGWIPPSNVEERTGVGEPYSHDTVSILARDRAGRLAGACSTSGMAFKVPGRVGDSPIIGHGLYVDQTAGAAAATGTGELIMGVCGSFLAVESMRQGGTPAQAIRGVLERIVRQWGPRLLPDHQVALIAMSPDGAWASAAIRPGFSHTISDDQGTRVEGAQTVLLP